MKIVIDENILSDARRLAASMAKDGRQSADLKLKGTEELVSVVIDPTALLVPLAEVHVGGRTFYVGVSS
jgi:hypothetical protein